jgi:hypothetical protein
MRNITDTIQTNSVKADSYSSDDCDSVHADVQHSAPKYDVATTKSILRSKHHVLFSRTLMNRSHKQFAIPKKYMQSTAVPIYDAALYTKEGSVFGMTLVSLLHGIATVNTTANSASQTASQAVAARLSVFSVFDALQQQFTVWQTRRETAATASATAVTVVKGAPDKTTPFDTTTAVATTAVKSSTKTSTKGFFSANGDTPISPQHTQFPVLAVPALRSLLQGSLGCCPSPPPAPHAPYCSEYNKVKGSVSVQWEDQYYPGSLPEQYKVEAKGMYAYTMPSAHVLYTDCVHTELRYLKYTVL